jgi:uncharacterized protein (DUF433 family)
MRWPVEVMLDTLSNEMSIQEFITDHPELEKENILAALQFARLPASGKSIKEVA